MSDQNTMKAIVLNEDATNRDAEDILELINVEGARVVTLTEEADWKTVDGAFRRDRYRLVSGPMYHDTDWEPTPEPYPNQARPEWITTIESGGG